MNPILHASSARCECRRPRRRQQGSALLFSLMALVVLLLGAMALVHSVSTGSGILGNLGFKQDATASADRVTREALTWLSSHASSLNSTDAQDGYYATSIDGLDATGTQDAGDASRALVNWDEDNCAYATSGTYSACKTPSSEITVQDSKARYIITRLCLTEGDPSATGNSCQRPLESSSTTASTKDALNYNKYARFTGSSGPYYRIIARVVGARNTVSYTETIVHF